MKKNSIESIADSNEHQEHHSETLTIKEKGNDYSLTIQHDQSGSSYGIDISEDVYNQLGDHFYKRFSTILIQYKELLSKFETTTF